MKLFKTVFNDNFLILHFWDFSIINMGESSYRTAFGKIIIDWFLFR